MRSVRSTECDSVFGWETIADWGGDISLTHCCQPTNKKKTSRTKFVQLQWLKLLINGLKTRKKEITNTQNITLQLVLMSFLWTSLTKVFVNISLASESLSLKPVGRELVRLITASKHLLVSHSHKTQEDTMTHAGGLSVPLLTMMMIAWHWLVSLLVPVGGDN